MTGSGYAVATSSPAAELFYFRRSVASNNPTVFSLPIRALSSGPLSLGHSLRAICISLLLLVALVQITGKATFVQFPDEPDIDEILRLRRFDLWISLPQRFENFFDPFQSWILFCGKYLVINSVVISFL